MANSKYEYVKAFEQEHYLLPDTYIVVRIDGKGFHKFSDKYNFQKPNDVRALQVMNTAARNLMNQFQDIVLGYGDSDEYSFLIRKECVLYERREMKLTSIICSAFTSYYLAEFQNHFEVKTSFLPMFDCRCVLYPTIEKVKDYFRWRQVDCHINNLYNTSFWTLVHSGMTNQQAEDRLNGTVSSDKHEILFKLGINYNNEPEMFKKGTVLVKEKEKRWVVKEYHVDVVKEEFWEKYTPGWI
ncbi:tRNA(His) guanylyltransferase [[Candida] jaroonii]|uniref:tRNA(His) guanylyltransferase n=1 Tax=[Candida] jaroonii TaxID=467808 RepID=A0ACA9Y5D3_9ASCO|nr:tRNA(His) guanylyltransferase [[Candida] jaroonii]